MFSCMHQRVMTNKHINCFTKFMGYFLVFLYMDCFNNPVITFGVDIIFKDCVYHEHVGTFINLIYIGC